MSPGERKWEVGENRPPTVRSDDIDNMDEEGDVGWAGHYEEVDYSKEVVFEDSSDEDSPKEEKKGRAHSVSVLCDGHACIHAASHLYVN